MIDKILANFKSDLCKTWFATWEHIPLSVNECTFSYIDLSQEMEILQRQHVPIKLNIFCAAVPHTPTHLLCHCDFIRVEIVLKDFGIFEVRFT